MVGEFSNRSLADGRGSVERGKWVHIVNRKGIEHMSPATTSLQEACHQPS